MAQTPQQFCPQCGTRFQPGQRFCTNCGFTMADDAYKPTALASNPQFPNNSSAGEYSNVSTPPPPPLNPGYDRTQIADVTPPPPPLNTYPNSTPGAQSFSSVPNAPTYPPDGPNRVPNAPIYPANVPNKAPGYNAQVAPASYPPVPAYAQKPKRGNGCLITSIVLLLILAAGVGGFILVFSRLNSNNNNNQANNNGNTNTNTGSNPTAGTTPASSIKTEQLNLSLVYSSVNWTILSTQESSSFSDDPGSSGSILVRINLQENNTTTSNADYYLQNSLLLVLPNGNTVQSSSGQNMGGPAASIKRTNWVDFELTNQVTLDQLVLRVGTQTENQMTIPLKPNADLSNYKDKTISPNATFKYDQVSWTLKTATRSYSFSGQQATTGNCYVLVNLSAVNNSTNDFDAYWGTYARLQTSGASASPESNSTLPLEVKNSGTAAGLLAFLVPQDATSFTLVFLAQANADPPITQATQAFTIQ